MKQRRIYQSEYPYFVTFRTKDNYPLFDELKYTALMSKVIFNSCNIKYFDVLSYQIMPDHVHLLTQNHKIDRTMLNNSAPAERCARGQSNGFNHIITERVSVPAMGPKTVPAMGPKTVPAMSRAICNISQLIYTIKSFFYHELRDQYKINYPIFQRRFYSRTVDTDRYAHTILRYIKHNPVKEGLPPQYHKMPYQHFDGKRIKELLK